jgi:hypothetical protein
LPRSGFAPGAIRTLAAVMSVRLTYASDSRATFFYGDAVLHGDPNVIWRRVGTDDVLTDP